MIAEPRRAYLAADPDTIKVVPAPRGYLMLECEVATPPSMAGRTVYVQIPPQQIPAVLKAARSAAVSIRNTPEGGHG